MKRYDITTAIGHDRNCGNVTFSEQRKEPHTGSADSHTTVTSGSKVDTLNYKSMD